MEYFSMLPERHLHHHLLANVRTQSRGLLNEDTSQSRVSSTDDLLVHLALLNLFSLVMPLRETVSRCSNTSTPWITPFG